MPTPTARPSLTVNGGDAPALNAALLDVTIVDDGEAPSACTARFSNQGQGAHGNGFLFFDLQHFDFGDAIRVALGDTVVFSGRLEAIVADFSAGTAPTISIRCLDRLSDLHRSRRSRTFEQVTDTDLVQRIANEHGLASAVALAGPTHATVAQLNQTSLEFLRERLRRIDAALWVEGDVVHAGHQDERHHGTIALAWGAELRRFSAAADLATQRTRVVVSGWDVAGKAPIESVASDDVIASGFGDGRSGASILSSTLGPYDERRLDPGVSSAAAAHAIAGARFKAAARQFVVVRGESNGSPTLRVGSRVAVSGVGLFSATYQVSDVRHRFDLDNGLRTTFTACSARLATAR